MPPPPVFSWTGVYIGAQVGYEWGHSSGAVYNTTTGNYIRSAVSSNPSGVVGGGHVGYDYQISQFVLGLEGDIDGASYQGTALQTPLITSRIRIPVDGAVLGRAGVAFDRVLVYATGGVAFGDLETTLFSPTLDDTNSEFRVGWTVGGGVQYAIDNNWSVYAQYRYTDYGNRDITLVNLTGGRQFVRLHDTDNRVQLGFSYQFDELLPPPPPVVAKY